MPMNSIRLTDSHLHATDPGFGEGYGDLGLLERFVSCTAKPDEWALLEAFEDPRAVRSYGVHPWYASEWTEGSEARLRSLLESDRNAHVGEIGLDSKRGTVAEQIPAFTEQLSIAGECCRVATVHDVGCEKEVLDAVRSFGKGCKGVILHSYGSDSYVKPFSEAGCFFSISPRILSRSDVRVKRLMDAIPMDLLLLETDAPHSGKGFAGMGDFVSRLASVAGADPAELAAAAAENLGRLVG